MEAYGHKNISSKHKNTLEFTTEDFVTKTGDCIVGINLKLDKNKIKKILKYRKVRITIKAGRIKDEIIATIHKRFSNFNEFVIRKSDYKCKRTFATNANKAAIDLNEKLKAKLKNPKQKIKITIEPVKIKAVVFDFDSTLEKWEGPQESIEDKIAKYASKKYNLTHQEFYNTFHEIRLFYEKYHKKPIHLDRKTWYQETFKRLNIQIPEKEIQHLTNMYWDLILKHIKVFPEIREVLKKLRGKYKLAVLSNSDGNKKIKMRKVNKLHLKSYFNLISTSDDVNINKPAPEPFIYIAKKLKVKPEECVMVGDHPRSDLMTSKKLGFTTILVRRSRWAEYKEYSYVDYDLKTLKTIPKIVKQLNQ